MTVNELIKLLKTYPQQNDLVILEIGEECLPIKNIYISKDHDECWLTSEEWE